MARYGRMVAAGLGQWFGIFADTPAGATLVADWKSAKIRVKPMDMRIAAIAIASDATLVTRNARDFKLIPGLKLDVWT